MPGLYVITDAHLIPSKHLTQAVAQAINGGATMVQYRNKTASDKQKQWEAQDLQILCQSLGVPLIINDDIVLAKTLGAAGVHLGKEDSNIATAKAALGAEAIIGVSCYQSITRALAAEQAGASYVAFGRFFPSHTKPEATSASLQLLTSAKEKLTIPIVAIGGITQNNCQAVIAAGADSVAVIHGVFGQASIQNAAQLIFNQLGNHLPTPS